MSLSATIGAARDCAKTLLFDSLSVHKFHGAVPHVMLVLDSQACILQKTLLEGYCDVMDAWNSQKSLSIDWSKWKPFPSCTLGAGSSQHRLPMRFPLSLSVRTPYGASDSITKTPNDHTSTVSYTLMPFIASELKEDMLRLQEFLRQCGTGQTVEDNDDGKRTYMASRSGVEGPPVIEPTLSRGSKGEMTRITEANSSAPNTPQPVSAKVGGAADSERWWTEDEFYSAYAQISKYLQPLVFSCHENPLESPTSSTLSSSNREPPNSDSIGEDLNGRDFCAALRRGPRRELLIFILIQRSAFQNELHEYRLRLSLFDRGMRVIEHCHLDSMSASADQLAIEAMRNDKEELVMTNAVDTIIGEDQIYSYCRSCAFSPSIALPLAKAIASTIDYHAWARKGDQETGKSADIDSSSFSPSSLLLPPALLSAMTEHHDIWTLFSKDSFLYRGVPGSQWANLRAMSEKDFESYLRAPVEGVGAPLKIVCRNSEKVLTFQGGLENCLMNTGFYSAAWEPVRNDVHSHRHRFTIFKALEEEKTVDSGPVASSQMDFSTAGSEGAGSTPHFGRLRKKDYLAMLQKRGEKPQGKHTRKRPLLHHEEADTPRSVAGMKRNAGAGGVDKEVETHMLQLRSKRMNLTAEAEEAEGAEGVVGSRISSSIGGTFPIGEVISESFDLCKLNGVCEVFGFPDPHKNIAFAKPTPFEMTIEDGKVVVLSDNAPRDFVDLWSLVKQTEKGCCYVRELGIGLNPYVGVKHALTDVTSFERQWGIHLSLGLRHPLFVKQRNKLNADGTVADCVEVKGPVIKRKSGKYHIDVFLDAAKLCCGPLVIDFSVPLLVS